MNNTVVNQLDPVLKLGSDTIITDIKTAPLIAKGENFGSILIKLDVKVKNQKSNTEEEINCVAKFIPEQEFLQKLFDVQNTVRNEIRFYNELIPSLQAFQKENGAEEVIDFFPKFYGGRLNLTGNETVDEDSVIILENLITSG